MYKADSEEILKAYESAKKTYAQFGIDTEKVITQFAGIPISLHNWQGDDVKGFEGNHDLSQNLVTGNYPGAARNADEMRSDIDMAFSLSPCKHRINLQSIYAEPKSKKDRNEYEFEDYENWVSWANSNDIGVDFNCSFFTHKMMKNGFSLSSNDKSVRDYWIKAGIKAREITEQITVETGKVSFNNIWVPDGLKDIPANRLKYREQLKDSLDQIFEKKYKTDMAKDFLEGKLFGIGTECFTVGSHDFYLGYAAKNNVGVCMDTGHYHPTESVADKLSGTSLFVKNILLHISRGIRWDSDHVVIQSDELASLMLELKRSNLLDKVGMGLDYFDASINRVAAWTIGLRAFGKSLLTALLEPTELIFKAEIEEDFTTRLALMEEFKNLPVNAVWNYVCLKSGAPVGTDWIAEVKGYENSVQLKRN